METKSMKRALSAVLGLSALLWTSTAYAAHPASVAGNWNAVGNQTTGTLAIVQAASAATCKPISGSIFGAGTTIQGSYCPSTGRIVFARRNAAGVPFQIYEGYVARDALRDRMGGTFMVWNAAGGGLANEGVDYNFSTFK